MNDKKPTPTLFFFFKMSKKRKIAEVGSRGEGGWVVLLFLYISTKESLPEGLWNNLIFCDKIQLKEWNCGQRLFEQKLGISYFASPIFFFRENATYIKYLFIPYMVFFFQKNKDFFVGLFAWGKCLEDLLVGQHLKKTLCDNHSGVV